MRNFYILFLISVFLFACKSDLLLVSDFHTDGSLRVNTPIRFVNASGNASAFVWNFGDYTVSNEINPLHTFKRSGKYLVQLEAKNESSNLRKGKFVLIENAINPLKQPDIVGVKSEMSLSQPILNSLPLVTYDGILTYVMQAKKAAISAAYPDSSKWAYQLLIQNWWTLSRVEKDGKKVSESYPELFQLMRLSDDGSYIFFENSTDTWKWGYWCVGTQNIHWVVLNAGSIYERMMQLQNISDAGVEFLCFYQGSLLCFTYKKYDSIN